MSEVAQDNSELTKLHEGFIEAFRNNDFDALGKFYLESAVLLPPGNPVVSGRDGILAYWQEAQRILDMRYETTGSTKLTPDVLQEIGKIEIMVRGTGRETKRRNGKYLTIWQKADESWKIASHGWSSEQPPGKGRRRKGGGGGGGGRRRKGGRGADE